MNWHGNSSLVLTLPTSYQSLFYVCLVHTSSELLLMNHFMMIAKWLDKIFTVYSQWLSHLSVTRVMPKFFFFVSNKFANSRSTLSSRFFKIYMACLCARFFSCENRECIDNKVYFGTKLKCWMSYTLQSKFTVPLRIKLF